MEHLNYCSYCELSHESYLNLVSRKSACRSSGPFKPFILKRYLVVVLRCEKKNRSSKIVPTYQLKTPTFTPSKQKVGKKLLEHFFHIYVNKLKHA